MIHGEHSFDVRDFEDIPREEMRQRIAALLFFLGGTSVSYALDQNEKENILAMAKEILARSG